MFQRELSETLIELIKSVYPPPGSGLVVTEAELEVPIETGGVVRSGELVFLGNVPHSRWQAGFLPPVAASKFRVTLDE